MRAINVMLVSTVVGQLAVVGAAVSGQSAPDTSVVQRRAISYLATEVPRWRREHPCYSCHNNGDGVRALATAARTGLANLRDIADAVGWLRTPERWALNAQDGGVKDPPLSRIQFASALAALVDAGGASQDDLDRAAALVVAEQRADGAWPISATSSVGTPSGYGAPLATAIAVRLLRHSTTVASSVAAARADAWLRNVTPQAVLEASSVLLGIEDAADGPATVARERALRLLKQGQGRDGGWGPYTSSASESFDTAVGVLALLAVGSDVSLAAPVYTPTEWQEAIARGRLYLRSQQNEDGSWPETTRPTAQESYSQRVSTTAWALLAMLEN